MIRLSWTSSLTQQASVKQTCFAKPPLQLGIARLADFDTTVSKCTRDEWVFVIDLFHGIVRTTLPASTWILQHLCLRYLIPWHPTDHYYLFIASASTWLAHSCWQCFYCQEMVVTATHATMIPPAWPVLQNLRITSRKCLSYRTKPSCPRLLASHWLTFTWTHPNSILTSKQLFRYMQHLC